MSGGLGLEVAGVRRVCCLLKGFRAGNSQQPCIMRLWHSHSCMHNLAEAAGAAGAAGRAGRAGRVPGLLVADGGKLRFAEQERGQPGACFLPKPKADLFPSRIDLALAHQFLHNHRNKRNGSGSGPELCNIYTAAALFVYFNL